MKTPSLVLSFAYLLIFSRDWLLPAQSQGISEYGNLQSIPSLGGSLGDPLSRAFGSRGTKAPPQARPAAVDSASATLLGQQSNQLYEKARAAQRKGKQAEAEKLYRQSLQLREQVWGSRDPSMATILIALSEIEQSQGKLADAEQTARKAVALMTRLYGSSSQYLRPSQQRLSAVLEARKKAAEEAPVGH